MARIRTIKPDFFTDDRLGECSVSARLALIACFVFADDQGNLERSAKQLKAQAFPYDKLDVEPLLAELLGQGVLVEYAHDGKTLLHIKGFHKHQRINRPSAPKWPIYDPSLRTHGGPYAHARAPEVEGKGKEGSTTTPLASSAKALSAGGNGGVRCTIPLNDGSEYDVTEAMVAEFSKLYPAVDVGQTLNEIRGWNVAHPGRRKTRRGALAHINGWLAKEQNRGPQA